MLSLYLTPTIPFEPRFRMFIINGDKWLTLSWRRPLSYRNQSIDFQSKSMDWFLYDNGLRHERVNAYSSSKVSGEIEMDQCNAIYQ